MTTAQFNLRTKTEQRVLIAKDVIEQLRAKKYIAEVGNYVVINNIMLAGKVGDAVNTDLKNALKNIDRCEVCARGAMFLSTVGFANACQISSLALGNDYEHGEDAVVARSTVVEDRLKDIFSKEQQFLIEAAFEGEDVGERLLEMWVGPTGDWVADGIAEYYEAVIRACQGYYSKYPNHKARLIAIMENIIKNKGKFTPAAITSNA